MRKFIATILSGVLLAASVGGAKAQIVYTTTDGMTQGQVWANIYADNARAAAAQGAAISAMAADAAALRAERAGTPKIAAGKATTRFASSNAVTERWIQKYLDGGASGDAAAREQTRQYLRSIVGQFDQFLAKQGLEQNDAANGHALALAVVYAIYNKQTLDPQTISILARQIRRDLNKSARFQGSPDDEKQTTYERYAVYAMDTLEQQRRGNEASALQKAAYAIEKLTGLRADNVRITSEGFFDKGTAIVKAGGGTTTFERDYKTLLSSGEMCSRHMSIGCGDYFKQLMQQFDGEVERRGGQTNDAAWSNAVAFALAYTVYTDEQVELNDAQLKSFLERMRRELVSSTAYQALSNEGKQKYYETTALESMRVYGNYRKGVQQGFSKFYTKDDNAKEAAWCVNTIFAPEKIGDYNLTPTKFVKKTR